MGLALRGRANHAMKLCLDFDGVIHDFKHPIPGRTMGPPLEGAVEGMQLLRKAGHTLVVFTSRGNRSKHVSEWLDYWKVTYDYVTNIKEDDVDLFIDDRAVTFVSWKRLLL